jgi:ABC-type transport system involved in multi-copper enzyme maturation permease subunit
MKYSSSRRITLSTAVEDTCLRAQTRVIIVVLTSVTFLSIVVIGYTISAVWKSAGCSASVWEGVAVHGTIITFFISVHYTITT